MHTREKGSIALIVVGIVLVLFVIGFFRSEQSFWDSLNYKKIMRLKCGVTVSTPKFEKDVSTEFPVTITGYINGCGWTRENEKAGTVQVFDSTGIALSNVTQLVIPSDSTESPFFFEAYVALTAVPQSDTGTLLFMSQTGLINPVQITF